MTADGTDATRASGCVVTDLDLGYVFDGAGAEVSPYVRLDNASNRRYVGAVSVGDSAPFIPAPGRTYWVGVNVKWQRE